MLASILHHASNSRSVPRTHQPRFTRIMRMIAEFGGDDGEVEDIDDEDNEDDDIESCMLLTPPTRKPIVVSDDDASAPRNLVLSDPDPELDALLKMERSILELCDGDPGSAKVRRRLRFKSIPSKVTHRCMFLLQCASLQHVIRDQCSELSIPSY